MTKRKALGIGGWLLLALFACGQVDPQIGPARNSLELRFGIRMFDRGEVSVLSGVPSDVQGIRTGSADLSLGFSHRIDRKWSYLIRASWTGIPASFGFTTGRLVDTTGALIFEGGRRSGPVNEMAQLTVDLELRRTVYSSGRSSVLFTGGISGLYIQEYRYNIYSSYYDFASPLLYQLNARTNGKVRVGLGIGLGYQYHIGKRSGLSLSCIRTFAPSAMYEGILTIAPGSVDRTVATVTQPSGNWLWGIGYSICLDKRPPKQPLEYGSR